jgi:hypothetical protein
MPEIKEPEVIINGVKLNFAEAMTLRVAISSYASEMSQKHALGKDKVGEDIRKGYLRNARKVEEYMFLNQG